MKQIQSIFSKASLGAPVAQWVKRRPTDLAAPGSSPARGELITIVTGIPLHTAPANKKNVGKTL